MAGGNGNGNGNETGNQNGKRDGRIREEWSEEQLRTARGKVEGIFERYHRLLLTHPTKNLYDTYLMSNATLISATPDGRVTYELVISPFYANLNGVMHGGAAGVIFDMCTTTALGPLSRRGYWDFLGGVTRSLNVSYLRAVPIGTTVRIESEVMQVGRTMALIRGKMVSLDGEVVYCTCEHHKVGVPSRKEHFPEDEVKGDDKDVGKGKGKVMGNEGRDSKL